MTFVMILQLLIVLAALYVGSRYGSLALGAISGIGLAILVLGFGMKPGNPPTDVIYIIIAAVTCAGIMQAAGGMDWLIQIAEKLLRKHPEHITFLAPLCTFFLTVLVGTGHVVYTLMPIICDISLKKGIRPERPCGVASVASQVGITCSPIAAAVASFVIISNDNGFDINNLQVIAVTIPACLCGLMAAALCSYKRGKDLDKDPVFLERKANPKMYKYMYDQERQDISLHIPGRTSGHHTLLFLPDNRPRYPSHGKRQAHWHEHHHPDCDDIGRRIHDHICQGQSAPGSCWQRLAVRNGCRNSHLRNCMAGRYIFRQLSAPDAGRSAGNCEQVSMGNGAGILCGIRAGQQPGRCCGSHAASGLLAGHSRPGTSGRVAIGLRLFLHPQLSVRYRNGNL